MLRLFLIELVRRMLLIGIFLLLPSVSAQVKAAAKSADSMPIASAGKPQASIVVGEAGGNLSRYAATELSTPPLIATTTRAAIDGL